MSRQYDPARRMCDACLNSEECTKHFRMKRWPLWNWGAGATYVSRWDGRISAASWNEGCYPNVHFRWTPDLHGFYIALAPGLKLYHFWKPFPFRRSTARE